MRRPCCLDALKAVGFNALSLSNNHAFDLGPGGILSTLEEVRKRGFLHAGIGADEVDASQPGILDTDKGRVALVSMDASPQPDHFYAGEGRPGINRQRVTETLKLGREISNIKAISERWDMRSARPNTSAMVSGPHSRHSRVLRNTL